MRDFLQTQEMILDSDNIAADLRIMNGGKYVQVMTDLIQALIEGAKPSAVMTAMDAFFNEILKESGPREVVRASYVAGLGLSFPVGPDHSSSSQGLSKGGIAGVVVGCVVGGVLVVMLGIFMLRRGRMHTLFGKPRAPGVGPSSTIIVTDIENRWVCLWSLMELLWLVARIMGK